MDDGESSEEADIEQAPEGGSEPARPDVNERDEGDEAPRDETSVSDPDPEQQDPESGPAADDAA